MLTHRFTDCLPGSSDPRAGLTLTEILIATGILLVGMLGALSVFPLALRNVQTAMDRTSGAAVADNVFSALDRRQLGITAPAPGSALPSNPEAPKIGYMDQPSPTAGGVAWDADTFDNMAEVIRSYHINTEPRGLGLRPVHDAGGAIWRTFRVPEDIENGGSIAGVGEAVSVPENPQLDWTAVFVPRTKNDNGVWYPGSDPYGDPSGNADDDGNTVTDDDPIISSDWTDDTTADVSTPRYRVQVAVWRNYEQPETLPGCATFWGYDNVDNEPVVDSDYSADGKDAADNPDQPTDPATGVPAPVSDEARIIMVDASLPSDPDDRAAVRSAMQDAGGGDYVRHRAYGWWFRIASVEQTGEDTWRITLANEFTHPLMDYFSEYIRSGDWSGYPAATPETEGPAHYAGFSGDFKGATIQIASGWKMAYLKSRTLGQ